MLTIQDMKTVIESATTTNIFTLEAVDFGYDKLSKQGFLQVRFNGQDFNLNFDYKDMFSGLELVDDKELLAKLYKADSLSYYLDENGIIRSSRKGDIATNSQKLYISINDQFERLKMTRITPSDMQQISEYLTLLDGYLSNL